MDPDSISRSIVRTGILIVTESDRLLDEVGHAAWLRSGGEAIEQALPATEFSILRILIMPRSAVAELASILRDWCDAPNQDYRCHLVLTAGGDGAPPDDAMVQATRAVLQQPAPGLVQELQIRAPSGRIGPEGLLVSTATAGVRRGTLIVNLPSTYGGAAEAIAVLRPRLPEVLEAIRTSRRK